MGALFDRVASVILDPTVLFSFDRTGFRRHARGFDPADLAVDLAGRRALVTGANSGIGFEAARGLAARGAHVVLLCRRAERGEAAAAAIRRETPGAGVEVCVLDVASLSSVRAAVAALGDAPVDILVHNAGVLPDTREESPEGLEATFATHVVGPFLLTWGLLPALLRSEDARVVWVSSGGMYAQRLSLGDLDWRARPYDGVRAYAQTKRMQVVLAELWAERLSGTRVSVHAMHPGWADTPAVRTSLPRFHRLLAKRLRTPAEAADTVLFLAAAPRVAAMSGRFWFDRRPRPTELLPGTHARPEDRRALWERCMALTGVDESALAQRLAEAGR